MNEAARVKELLSHSFPMPNGHTLKIETSTGDGATLVTVTEEFETPNQYAKRRAEQNIRQALALDRQMADVRRVLR